MILENKADDFCKSPTDVNLEISLNRKESGYEDLSHSFACLKKDFKEQFSHIYTTRLELTKNKLIKACISKWGSEIPIRKLSELTDENDSQCIVIGTLFKHQKLKPSILKEISEENQILPQPQRINFASDDDQLILEDEIQRIRLIGAINVKKLVTGIVVGLLGFENHNGKFEVKDICFPGTDIGPEMPLSLSDDCYVLLVSGLHVGGSGNKMAVELLIDWIKGELGSVADQKKWTKLSRVLIAGNSTVDSNNFSDSAIINTEIDGKIDTVAAIQQLDDILKELVETIEVHLMPGEFDPSNYILPQQSINDCVFPKASQYESFYSVTNPYKCVIGGRKFLGTSGQPINDIKALTDNCDSLDILESTLHWGHLAPTAPDTLACYPYYSQDPFIITEQPDIYFAGNQPELQIKTVSINGCSTTLISIPAFSSTQACVIVNLRTLECTPLNFTLEKM